MGTALPKNPKREKTNRHPRVTITDFKKLLNFMCMYVYHVYAEALRHQKIVVSHIMCWGNSGFPARPEGALNTDTSGHALQRALSFHSARTGLTSYSVLQLLALSKAPNWQHHLENFWKRQILKYHFQKFHFISKICTFLKTHHDFYVQLCLRTPSLLWSTVTFEESLCEELSILSWLRVCLWGTFLT